MHFGRLRWVFKKKVQSKQEALLYESGPLASISFDRTISSRAHSHVCCGSLMPSVRISLAKRKVLGGEGEHPGPAVLPCPLWRTFPSSWLPNQSASCGERELPCPCHNKWLPWLQQQHKVKLSAAHNRPYLTKLSQQKQVWGWVRNVVPDILLYCMNSYARLFMYWHSSICIQMFCKSGEKLETWVRWIYHSELHVFYCHFNSD